MTASKKTVTVLDTEPAPSGNATKLPALGSPELSVAYLARMKEVIEVLTGQRGPSKLDRAVTFRDLHGVLPDFSQAGRQRKSAAGSGDASVPGGTDNMSPSALDLAIRNSAAYKELTRKIGSVEDLETFPDEIRAFIRNELGKVAAERGAAIEETRTIVQEATRSYAVKMTEVTASLGKLSSGVRHVDAAYASKTRAFATSLTQVTARIDNVGGATGVTLEQKFVAQADVNTGLLGQYSVKIMSGTEANPVIAGFALSSETPVAGPTTSAFTILADKFGIYTGGGDIMPFAVSGSTVYINGLLKVGSPSGSTLQTLTDGMINFVGDFASAPAVGSYRVNDVYKNTSDGNSYILKSGAPNYWSVFIAKGTNGSPGSPGSPGTRGTVQIIASGASWSDSTATSAIQSGTGTNPINHDQVTITNNSSFSQTRFYSGTYPSGSWLTIAAWINGNMVVDGTLSANKITAGTMSADRISGGTLIGATIKTATNFTGNGQFVIYDTTAGGGNANKIIGYDTSGTLRVELSATTGTLNVDSTSSFLTAIRGTASGAGMSGVSGTAGSGSGVIGTSTSGAGGKFSSTSGNAIDITNGANGIVQSGGGSNFIRTINPGTDNTYALGTSGSYRWTALYAMSATITTSDVRTKNLLDGPKLGLAFINDLDTIRYTMRVGENVVTDNFVEIEPARTATDEQGNEVQIAAVIENQPIVTPRPGTRVHYGLPAQQLRETLLAHGEDNAAMWCLADKDDPDSQQAVRYEELIAPLIRAVQELSGQVNELKAKVAQLEAARA